MAIQQQQTGNQADISLTQAIEMVAKDKGIDKVRLVKTVEEAILKAAQSVFGPTASSRLVSTRTPARSTSFST